MRSLAALDLYFLCKEFAKLEGAHVDKVYQPSKEELFLQVHKDGKHGIKILLGQAVFLSSEKSVGEQLTYAKFLRKQLGNARMKVVQPNFERILEFHFSGKEERILIVELFSKGNAILCDTSYKIIAPFLKQTWKDRVVQAGAQYVLPPSSYIDITKVSQVEFKKAMRSSDKESTVKALAIDCGLGGTYAEEMCVRAGIDKNAKGLSDREYEKLYAAIKEVLALPIAPCIAGVEVFPFRLVSKDCKEVDSFSAELEKRFSTKDVAVSNQQSKLLNAIKAQENRLQELKQEIEDEKRKGELIYEHYADVEELLNSPVAKLKNFPFVKEVDEKARKVTIEL